MDLSNALSLKYLLPLGGHDLDLLVGDMEVRLAREGDDFSPPEGLDAPTENVPPGEPVYADQAEVRTRRWVWREGRKARITENTRNIFLPVDGWTGLNDGQVRVACQELAQLFEEKLGAKCQVFFLYGPIHTFTADIFTAMPGNNYYCYFFTCINGAQIFFYCFGF